MDALTLPEIIDMLITSSFRVFSATRSGAIGIATTTVSKSVYVFQLAAAYIPDILPQLYHQLHVHVSLQQSCAYLF